MIETLRFPFSPWRLSGVVYGTLFNDPAALAALGDTVNQPPYQAPPKSPPLYLKPRNTLNRHGAEVQVPAEVEALEIGANLGLVIGRTACRVAAADALGFVAGYVIVNDVSVPHAVYYRPSLRYKARDGFCPIGPQVVPAGQVPTPDRLGVQVFIDGVLRQSSSTAGRTRSAAQLLAEVTAFMTLQPGDVLMLGAAANAPLVRAGETVAIEIDGLGRLENPVRAEAEVLP